MDWAEWAKVAIAALLGAGGGLLTGRAALVRVRSQNHKDDADALATVSKAVADLSARLSVSDKENDARMDELRAQLTADIEVKDIRLRRLESDVITLKRSLSEWQAYAMGLHDMLVKLKQTPPEPPKTGPLQ